MTDLLQPPTDQAQEAAEVAAEQHYEIALAAFAGMMAQPGADPAICAPIAWMNAVPLFLKAQAEAYDMWAKMQQAAG